jgi:GNAT superfamily N-acetyltransferase
MPAPLSFEVLRPETVVPKLHEMTFPSYRKFLTLEPGVRHPEQGDKRVVQPVALVAWQGELPVGMILAERPVEAAAKAEILSIFVAADRRNTGVATGLVRRLEEHLRANGVITLSAVYMTGTAGIPAIERVFEKAGWLPPETRAISVRFTPDEALRTPWFGRVSLPEGFEVFPWTDLKDAEKVELVRSHEASPWIAKGLEPWRHDFYGFDPVSSIGLRWKGKVVGWVINHQMGPGNVRFTCSFMHPELSKRGRIFPLYTASLLRLREVGCRICTLVTPMYYKEMAMFLRRRCIPWVQQVSESRGVSKDLSVPSAR